MKEFHGIHQVFTYEKTETKKNSCYSPFDSGVCYQTLHSGVWYQPIQARYAAKFPIEGHALRLD
jgi:hypothetical protein